MKELHSTSRAGSLLVLLWQHTHNTQRNSTVATSQDYCTFQLYRTIKLGFWLALKYAEKKNQINENLLCLFVCLYLYVFWKTSLNIMSIQVLPRLEDRPVGESLKYYLSLSKDFWVLLMLTEWMKAVFIPLHFVFMLHISHRSSVTMKNVQTHDQILQRLIHNLNHLKCVTLYYTVCFCFCGWFPLLLPIKYSTLQ